MIFLQFFMCHCCFSSILLNYIDTINIALISIIIDNRISLPYIIHGQNYLGQYKSALH